MGVVHLANVIKRNLTSRKRCNLIGHPNSSAVERSCFLKSSIIHYAIMLTSVGSGYIIYAIMLTSVGSGYETATLTGQSAVHADVSVAAVTVFADL